MELRERLDRLAEFDCPFEVRADGTVNTDRPNVYAPSVYQYCDEDGQAIDDPEIDGEGWSFVDGYSGQQGYSGPVMHPSEFLGGRMADDVLAEPGIYCVVEVMNPDDLDDLIGWALMRKDSDG